MPFNMWSGVEPSAASSSPLQLRTSWDPSEPENVTVLSKSLPNQPTRKANVEIDDGRKGLEHFLTVTVPYYLIAQRRMNLQGAEIFSYFHDVIRGSITTAYRATE